MTRLRVSEDAVPVCIGRGLDVADTVSATRASVAIHSLFLFASVSLLRPTRGAGHPGVVSRASEGDRVARL